MATTHDQPLTPSTKTDLDDLVASHDRLLVEFHTEGCGKCKAMAPVLDAVAGTTAVTVATMNPRNDPVLVDEYDVRSVPKLLLFVDGDLAATREDGVLSVDDATDFATAPE